MRASMPGMLSRSASDWSDSPVSSRASAATDSSRCRCSAFSTGAEREVDARRRRRAAAAASTPTAQRTTRLRSDGVLMPPPTASAGPQHVAEAADGVEDARAVLLELAAERADVHLDEVGVVVVVAPDLREQLRLREDAAALVGEVGEQPVLRRGEVELAPPRTASALCSSMSRSPRSSVAGTRPSRRSTARTRATSSSSDERLHHVVVGAGAEPGQPVGAARRAR